MTLVYNDFAVRFEVDAEGGLQARVAPHSGDSAPSRFVSPLEPESLDRVLRLLEGDLRRSVDSAAESLDEASDAERCLRRRRSREASQPTIVTVGGALFDALFSGPVSDAYRDACIHAQGEGRGVRLRLVFDPDAASAGVPLAALPWEGMYDRRRGRFLCHDPRTPIVRHLRRGVFAHPHLKPISGALRVLVLQAQPPGLRPLDLETERRGIEAALGGQRHDLELSFVPSATLADLRRALHNHDPHILHFMGHGTLEAGGLGALHLETPDGRRIAVGARQLGVVLAGCESLRLAVLNACRTSEMPRKAGRDPFSSVATALVENALPAVVAMQFAISDRAAIAFAGDFYRALAAGDPIEAAMAEGRQAVLHEVGNREWLTPTLYLRMDHGQLFRPPDEPTLGSRIQKQEALLHELGHHFVGREFVFEELASFCSSNPCGTFVIEGDPGVGKSALAVQIIRQTKAIYHFNIRSNSDANRTRKLLENLCAQLIVRWRLPHTTLIPEALEGPTFFAKLLDQAAGRLSTGERLVLVIDAVDEVVDPNIGGGNLFHLPDRLPEGVFIVLTSRRPRKDSEPDWSYSTHSPCQKLELDNNSEENLVDIRSYIEKDDRRNHLDSWWRPRGLDRQGFIELLKKRSEGNFRYLHHVLPELRDGGLYQTQSFDKIPFGLKKYYEDHWRCIRELRGQDWIEYQLPVVAALTVVKRPIPFELIHFLTQIENPVPVLAVLLAWNAFLHEEDHPSGNILLRCYRLYHQTFIDFVAERDEVDLTRTVCQMKELLYERFLEENKADDLHCPRTEPLALRSVYPGEREKPIDRLEDE